MDEIELKEISTSKYGKMVDKATAGYLTVKTRDLFAGSVLPFEVLFPAFEEARQLVFLRVLAPEGNTCDDSMRDWFQRQGIEEVYIRKDQEDAFFEYLSANVKALLKSPGASAEQKAMLLYDSAESIVNKVFRERPSRSNVALGCELIENIAVHVTLDTVTSDALLNIFSKDYYTFTHSVQVAMLGMAFCKYLNWSKEEVNDFGIGALFHDVGKSHIEDEILNKPSGLTEDEFRIIKKHPVLGYQKLKDTQILTKAQLLVPLYHHEAMNGSGYPEGLKSHRIHKYARVARIIDVYDALTTRRTYKNALTRAQAIDIMSSEMGPTFDLQLLNLFIKFLDQLGKGKQDDAAARSNRINLEMGGEVYVGFSGSDIEMKSVLMGMEAGKALILRIPAGFQASELLREGNELAATYVQGCMKFGFKAKILSCVTSPIPFIVISYPLHVESVNLRTDQRLECLIRAKVRVRGKIFDAVLLNIGKKGCKVVIRLPENEETPDLVLGEKAQVRIIPLAGEQTPGIEGAIRNIDLEKKKALLGLEFEKPAVEILETIRRYGEKAGK